MNVVKNDTKKQAAMPSVNTSLEGERARKSIRYLTEFIKELNTWMEQYPQVLRKEKCELRKTEIRIKALETQSKLDALIPILESRDYNYNNVFLPRHRAQIAECELHFDKYFELAKEFAAKTEHAGHIITNGFNAYMKENPERTDTELNLAFFQGMRQMFDKMSTKKK